MMTFCSTLSMIIDMKIITKKSHSSNKSKIILLYMKEEHIIFHRMVTVRCNELSAIIETIRINNVRNVLAIVDQKYTVQQAINRKLDEYHKLPIASSNQLTGYM